VLCLEGFHDHYKCDPSALLSPFSFSSPEPPVEFSNSSSGFGVLSELKEANAYLIFVRQVTKMGGVAMI